MGQILIRWANSWHSRRQNACHVKSPLIIHTFWKPPAHIYTWRITSLKRNRKTQCREILLSHIPCCAMYFSQLHFNWRMYKCLETVVASGRRSGPQMPLTVFQHQATTTLGQSMVGQDAESSKNSPISFSLHGWKMLKLTFSSHLHHPLQYGRSCLHKAFFSILNIVILIPHPIKVWGVTFTKAVLTWAIGLINSWWRGRPLLNPYNLPPNHYWAIVYFALCFPVSTEPI